jgi:hypothetical protein
VPAAAAVVLAALLLLLGPAPAAAARSLTFASAPPEATTRTVRAPEHTSALLANAPSTRPVPTPYVMYIAVRHAHARIRISLVPAGCTATVM